MTTLQDNAVEPASPSELISTSPVLLLAPGEPRAPIAILLDPDLPLTAGELPEFGDPAHDLFAYWTIAGYSPYDNVKAQPYPPMLVTAGLSDPRTQYWEPAKWVAKLRAMKTNGSRIVLIPRMTSGHFGAPGRFKALEEVAMFQAFALDVTGKR